MRRAGRRAGARGPAAAAIAAAIAAAGVFGGAAAPASAATLPTAAVDEACPADSRIAATPLVLAVMQSELAWSVTRGAGVVVAVVDSGVDDSSAHLAGVVLDGVNLVPDRTASNGTADLNGHGTAIAAQIAARPVDGSGLIGLAPDVRILPVRVYAGTGDAEVEAGFGPSTARMAEGIRAAADRGAEIINVSMSTTRADAALGKAVAYATRRGSLVVASSGNRDGSQVLDEANADRDGIRFPAGDAGAIGVAAADTSGVVTDASIAGPHVSLAAPGAQISSVALTGGDCTFAADAPATSFAAGYVSAAAALVAAAHPDETPAEWAYRLEATATRADPDRRDDVSGWGIAQPYDAIVLEPGPGVRGPISPFVASDAGEPGAAASAAPIVVAAPDPASPALAWGVAAGAVALVMLGAFGAMGVLKTRRRLTETHAAAPAPSRTGGLYGPLDRVDEG